MNVRGEAAKGFACIIRADVLAPVEWAGVVVGPYLAAGALPDEYVVRLTDGRTVALRPHEFYPAP